jgi:hypothetical protein
LFLIFYFCYQQEKKEEKSQEYKNNEKEIVEVSDFAILILKNLQYHKKKHDILSTKKHTLPLTKYAKYIITTTTIFI